MARKAAKAKGVYEKTEGSGVWYVRYKVNGKTVRKAVGTRQQALEYLTKVRYVRSTGEGILPETARRPAKTFAEIKESGGLLTVGALCDQYLAHIQHADNPDRPKDQVNPPTRVKAIRKAFGERPAGSVKPHEIKDWLIQEVGGAPATMNRYKSTFSAIYSYAKHRSLVESNPVRDAAQFKVKLPPPRYLTEAEEKRLFAVLHRWIAECPVSCRFERLSLRSHPLEIDIAIGTGLRKSNQYELRWDWVDFPDRMIRIPDSKNDDAITLPMIDRVRNALLELQQIQAEVEELRKETTDEQSPSRMLSDGRVFLIRENRTWWAKALREAKIADFRWHDLRHTTASLMVQAGVNLKAVQETLAHRSIATTARYAHMNKSTLMEAMSVLNR